MIDEHVSAGLIHQLVGETLCNEDPILASQVETFRHRPRGPILPDNCLEARRIPEDLRDVFALYLMQHSEGSEPELVLRCCYRGSSEEVIRTAKGDYRHTRALLSPELLGFVDGLPLVVHRRLALHQQDTTLLGHYLGDEKISEEAAVKYLTSINTRAQMVSPPDRIGWHGDGHEYELDGYTAILLLARHKHLRYYLRIKRRKRDHSPDPYKQGAFRHVTPPFRTKSGWQYWGTIGTHLCRMELPKV
jgi:hypothetical protein